MRDVDLGGIQQEIDIRNSANDLQNLQTGSYANIIAKQTELLELIKEMKNNSKESQAVTEALISKLKATEMYIQTNASAMLDEQIKKIITQGIGTMNEYVLKVQRDIIHEAARYMLNFLSPLLLFPPLESKLYKSISLNHLCVCSIRQTKQRLIRIAPDKSVLRRIDPL